MIENLAIHLTNNAIQKKDEAYGKLEDGNQLSYAQATVSVLKLMCCVGNYRRQLRWFSKGEDFARHRTLARERSTEAEQKQQEILLWDSRIWLYGRLVLTPLADWG
jgi:hypothetical protein